MHGGVSGQHASNPNTPDVLHLLSSTADAHLLAEVGPERKLFNTYEYGGCCNHNYGTKRKCSTELGDDEAEIVYCLKAKMNKHFLGKILAGTLDAELRKSCEGVTLI